MLRFQNVATDAGWEANQRLKSNVETNYRLSFLFLSVSVSLSFSLLPFSLPHTHTHIHTRSSLAFAGSLSHSLSVFFVLPSVGNPHLAAIDINRNNSMHVGVRVSCVHVCVCVCVCACLSYRGACKTHVCICVYGTYLQHIHTHKNTFHPPTRRARL